MKPGMASFFYRQFRHPPGMDHVVGGNEEAHLGARGQDQGLVHFQQVVLTLVRGVVDLALGSAQITEKADVFPVLVEVFVLPLPLVAGDQHVQFGIVVVVDVDQGAGGRHCHADEDDERHDRPQDLHLGALVERGRGDAAGFAVVDDGIEHHAKHANADHHADPEDDHVQVVNLPAHLGGARRHIDLVGFSTGGRRGKAQQHQHRS